MGRLGRHCFLSEKYIWMSLAQDNGTRSGVTPAPPAARARFAPPFHAALKLVPDAVALTKQERHILIAYNNIAHCSLLIAHCYFFSFKIRKP